MKLHIEMFGEFTIYVDGEKNFQYEGRTRKLWNLLQYLLVNRNRPVPQAELFSIAHLDGKKGKPENSLKNLIYRLRGLLEESDLPKEDYILCRRGAYQWNPEISVTLDIEVFEQEYREAMAAAGNMENSLVHYMAALEQYHGVFLPKSQDEEWVREYSAHYQKLFFNCMKEAYNIFSQKKDLGFMEQLCRRSIEMQPQSEELYQLYIQVLMQQNQHKQALEVYASYETMLYKESGQKPSESLQTLYREIIKELNNMHADISTVKNDLREANAGNGAYYCPYDIFKNMYRLLARSVSRTGQSVYLLLFTVSDTRGELPTIKRLNASMRSLQLAIGKSLRKGDVYSQYSGTQYVVMLQSINEENGKMVVGRILKNYEQLYQEPKVVVNFMLEPLDPVEKIPEGILLGGSVC